MDLLYKPDADQALRRWDAFWQGDMIDRPPVCITVPREGVPEIPLWDQLSGFDEDLGEIADRLEATYAAHEFLGEAFPAFAPSVGPDQFAAFLGCPVVNNPDSAPTLWVTPCVEDWESALPLALDPDNYYWRHIREFYAYLRPRAQGKYLLKPLDQNGNMECLAAMRGFEAMCLDMVERPELVDRAVAQVRELFGPVYDAVYEAGGMGEQGYTGSWAGTLARGKHNVLACDFAALMSPAMFDRWVMPCLEAETEFLDHTLYHLDGPDAIRHLPSLLGLPRLHCIQWIVGDGLRDWRPIPTWVELYQRIQATGRACQVLEASIPELKQLHPHLKPNLVQYCTYAATRAEGEEFLQWLVENS
jgi:5-methyltetrahydrofolate--homocysteine methyltransferase